MNKYKSPNGNILSEADLINQYGEEKFAQFINEGKLILVTEEQTEEVESDVYITPTGSELTQSE